MGKYSNSVLMNRETGFPPFRTSHVPPSPRLSPLFIAGSPLVAVNHPCCCRDDFPATKNPLHDPTVLPPSAVRILSPFFAFETLLAKQDRFFPHSAQVFPFSRKSTETHPPLSGITWPPLSLLGRGGIPYHRPGDPPNLLPFLRDQGLLHLPGLKTFFFFSPRKGRIFDAEHSLPSKTCCLFSPC